MTTAIVRERPTAIRLRLRENLAQFALLVVVNAFVGAMVGMERSILPVPLEVIGARSPCSPLFALPQTVARLA